MGCTGQQKETVPQQLNTAVLIFCAILLFHNTGFEMYSVDRTRTHLFFLKANPSHL